MEKLIKNPNVLMVGAGIISYFGIKYLINNQLKEKKSTLNAKTSISTTSDAKSSNEDVSNACGCGG